MRSLFAFARIALSLLALLLPSRALADVAAAHEKVAVLPFTGVGQATARDLDDARAATRAAVVDTGHTLPADVEMLSAQMAVKDGVADTSEEYRAAGRASGSQWTIAGHVEPRGGPYRLELEVCQVDSGRVESLAREVAPQDAPREIAEMLALLLRPEGIANAEIPWERAQNRPPPPPVSAVPAPPPPGPPAPEHAYAEGHPFAVGIGGGVTTAIARPSNARGSATAGFVEGTAGYALEQVPGLELRGDIAAAIAGPGSVLFDVGARYAIPVAPAARLFAGPEAAIGAFFPTGGDRSARFYTRGSAFLAIGVGEQAQLELSADLAGAFGSASIGLAGATARALVRF